ncbi:hypothetical protein GIB67_010274 [Kingdonia uniflora]|uniref:BRISC and BRCA1-A complex member 1 n=1 Tax=Kingdonia uniflora TaxID=39325 RepID=A0A7J7NB76_9MAGN|nr:hypothetical protein GIB67_010274 [Kingdonia uniflora]
MCPRCCLEYTNLHDQPHRKELSNDVEFAKVVLGAISATTSYGQADLTQLFRIAAHEAKKSRAQNRIYRVILIYCRSSVPPHHQWPATQKTFTFDVMYLHDKPGPDNCPQKVYDTLGDTLESISEYEGYIFESGQSVSRVLFRKMCILLSHPQQRVGQDHINFPKSLAKKSVAAEGVSTEESVSVPSSQ